MLIYCEAAWSVTINYLPYLSEESQHEQILMFRNTEVLSKIVHQMNVT